MVPRITIALANFNTLAFLVSVFSFFIVVRLITKHLAPPFTLMPKDTHMEIIDEPINFKEESILYEGLLFS